MSYLARKNELDGYQGELGELKKKISQAELNLRKETPRFGMIVDVSVVSMQLDDETSYAKLREEFTYFIEVNTGNQVTGRTGFFVELSDAAVCKELEELTDFTNFDKYDWAYIYLF